MTKLTDPLAEALSIASEFFKVSSAEARGVRAKARQKVLGARGLTPNPCPFSLILCLVFVINEVAYRVYFSQGNSKPPPPHFTEMG